MSLQRGIQLPDVTVFTKNDDGIEAHNLKEWSRGLKIVFFCVPGAFTQTCSERHLPGFIEHRDKFSERGIDAVVCIAVNDPHVMDAWGKQVGAKGKIEMMADPLAELATALQTRKDFGIPLGVRSKRCGFITNDGLVTYSFVEEPGELTGSGAEAMLAALDD
jgi:peroxiredoxin